MLDREPFLTAIFADPDNDLPRLVFADYLDDQGDHDWAEVIRLQCEFANCGATAAGADLMRCLREVQSRRWPETWMCRGLSCEPSDLIIRVSADDLADPDGLRLSACERHPHWYGADCLSVTAGVVTEVAQVETLLRSPVTAHVRRLILRGREEQLGTSHHDALGIGLIDFVLKPIIAARMVDHLCGLREARRLVSLDLSYNDLDNDSIRAILRSTNLIRLTELTIQDGNTRVKGRLWGELRRQFPEGVVL